MTLDNGAPVFSPVTADAAPQLDKRFMVYFSGFNISARRKQNTTRWSG